MTINQIRTFLVVCRCMSFTEAATALNLTQSAVSRQMSTLEEELGVRIFDRKNNLFRLTGAGRRLQSGFTRLLSDLDQLTAEARKIDRGIQGELRVGVLSDQAIDDTMGKALRTLAADGTVDLVISRLDFKGLYQGLLGGSIDVANTIIHSENFFPECEKLLYAHEPLYLAVRADRGAGLTPPLSLQDLDDFTKRIPIKAPALDTYVESQRLELGIQFQRARSYNSFTDFGSIIPLVSVGLCATMVNRTHVLSLNQEVALYPLEQDDAVDKGLLWIPGNPNPMIPKLLELIKEDAH